MKKSVLIVSMLTAFGIAFYEQSLPRPNVIITVLCVVVFMFGMMTLSAKTPSKFKDENDEEL